MQENSGDHPGEEDNESDLAEQQQDAMEVKSDFRSVSGHFICRRHVQDRQKFCVSQESSVPIPPADAVSA